MKTFADNKLIKNIANGEAASFLEVWQKADSKSPFQINLKWPSLLEIIDEGALFENISKIDQNNPFVTTLVSYLLSGLEKDLVIRCYDELFTECLVQIKSLPQMDPVFLFNQIQQKRQSFSQQVQELLSADLDYYESALRDHTAYTMHDLILYLAWDRMCVYLTVIFDHPSSDPHFRQGIAILKECLIESFQHITGQGRTIPSFFRLMEALYAYDMRDENLQSYNEEDWLVLCQASSSLKPREALADVFYIDASLIHDQQKKEKNSSLFFTSASSETVKATLALAHLMLKRLREEVPDWSYMLSSTEVVYLKQKEDGLTIDAMNPIDGP